MEQLLAIVVADKVTRIKEYLTTSNVQLGGLYAAGKQSTFSYNAGYEAAAKYINASLDEIGTVAII